MIVIRTISCLFCLAVMLVPDAGAFSLLGAAYPPEYEDVIKVLKPYLDGKKPFMASVVNVIDGDSFEVSRLVNDSGCKNSASCPDFPGRVTVRLDGVSSPKIKQSFGTQSKNYLSSLVLGRTVMIRPSSIDDYGRIIAIAEVSGVTVQETILVEGLSWVYPKYCSFGQCRSWAQMELKARTEKKGLWSESSPVAPWVWRKTNHDLY